MHRLFVSKENISGNKIIISARAQVHYLRDVLRLEAGDKLTVFDQKRQEYDCLIEAIADKADLRINKKRVPPEKEAGVKITVACAIPKKGRMEDIIDKLTQLGTERIVPLETVRVIVRLDQKKKAIRLERWKKIALGAAQQSQRKDIPIIEPITDMKGALSAYCDYDLKLIPHLGGKRKTLKEILLAHRPRRILVFIGPEGDFSPQEVEMAIKAGCLPVTLGDLVLRVETAAVAVASFIQLYADS